MKKRTWKRAWTVLMICTMLLNLIPLPATAGELPPEPSYEEADAAPDDDSGPSDILISPASVNSGADIRSVISRTGHAYAVSNGKPEIFSDPEMTSLLCVVQKPGTIYYADEYGSSVRVWFSDQDRTIVCGYLNPSVLDSTVLDDSTAESMISYGALAAEINGRNVTVFITSVNYPEAENIIPAEQVPGESDPGETEESPDLSSPDETDCIISEESSSTVPEGEALNIYEETPIESGNSPTDEKTPEDESPAKDSLPENEDPSAGTEGQDLTPENPGKEQDVPDSDLPENEASSGKNEPEEDTDQGRNEMPEYPDNNPEDHPEEDGALITPEMAEIPLSAGEYVVIPANVHLFSQVDTAAAGNDYTFGPYLRGLFTKDTVAEIKQVLQDDLGTTWYEAGYLFGEYADATGELMWSEEDTVFVPAQFTKPAGNMERELIDITPVTGTIRLRSLASSASSAGVDPSALVSSGFSRSSSDIFSSLTVRSSDGGPEQIWRKDGTQLYTVKHYKVDDAGYLLFCIQPTLAMPGSSQNHWNYSAVGLDTYSDKVYTAIRYCIRHGYPFCTYRGDAENTRRMTTSAIRQVLLDLDASYTGNKYELNGGGLTGNGRTDSIYNTSNFNSESTQAWLNYARWLAAEAVAEATRVSEEMGAISLSNKQGLDVSGSGYTGSVVVTTGCDGFWIAKSPNYSLSGYTTEDSGWYYFERGATVGVSTSNTSVSFEIASYSSSSEVGLTQYRANSSSSARQDLVVPWAKEMEALQRTTVSFTYTPPHGSVSVIKKDDSGNVMSGVSFTLSNASLGYSSTKATDGAGKAEWADLTPGTYTLTESTPVGYIANSSRNVTVTAGTNTNVDVVNTLIRATVIVTKYRKVMYSGMTPKTLAGAVLELRQTGTSTVVGTRAATDGNGQIAWTGIPYGTYDIYEVSPPEGYQGIGVIGTVTVSEPQVVYRPSVINEPIYGSVAAVKYRKGTTTPLAGAKFELLDSTKQARALDISGNETQVKTTGTDGVVRWDNIEYGTYYIRETEAPVGYQLDQTPQKVVVETQNDIVRFDASDDWISGYIRIIKRCRQTDEPIAGAEFDVLDSAGHTAAHLVTDASGEARTGLLEYGDYTVKETRCPEIFLINESSFPVEIREHEKTYDVAVPEDANYGWIELVKLDELDNHPIEGVEFEIVRGENVVETLTTDAVGYAKSGKLVCDTYTVREKANPTGYIDVLSAETGTVAVLKVTSLRFTNKPIQGKIQIYKTDELTKEALAGAEFTITRISGLPSHKGEGNGDVVAVITTGSNGIAETGLLTYGRYEVAETVVPEHFKDKNFRTEVSITTDSKDEEIVYPIDVPNEPTPGWVRLVKTDRVTGNPIPGIAFDVYRYVPAEGQTIWEITENREFVETITTDNHGAALSSPVLKGCYYVVEKQPTPGYYFEKVEFDGVIVKSDEVTPLTASNFPVQITLSVYKRDDDLYHGAVPDHTADRLPEEIPIDAPDPHGDAKLTGAEFMVTADADILDRQGNLLFHSGDVVEPSLITQGDDARIVSAQLFPGKYCIREINPPEGYLPNETEIHIDATLPASQSDLDVVNYQALFLNEVKKGRYGIIKFFGDNAIHTDAGLLENAEANATFAVWLSSAGSYDNAREDERDILVTNAFGKAKTRDLPYGVYTIKQLSGKPGYAIKSPYNFRITGDEDPYDTPMDIINNEAYHYWLKIIKTDEETGKTITLSHASFKLKDEDGNFIVQNIHYPKDMEIDVFETDDTGSVQLPETLLWGKYYICELKSPEGYLLPEQEIEVDVGALADETFHVEVSICNTPVKGNVIIEKAGLQLTGFETLQENGYSVLKPVFEDLPLAGAVFEIRAAEDITGKDETVWFHAGELACTVTTSAGGHDKSADLPLGKYYVTEKSAPAGYVFSGERYDVDLVYADDHTARVTASVSAGNDFLRSELYVEKEKETLVVEHLDNGMIHQVIRRAPGDGFAFGLYNATPLEAPNQVLPAGSLLSAAKTDADGRLSFSGCFPHGEYYIQELESLDGWILNAEEFPVSLTPDLQAADEPVIRVRIPGKILNQIVYTPVTITKTDLTEEETIPGALIEIYDEAGNVIYREYTDENGEIPDIPLKPGKYTFREILAPEGYALNTAILEFEVDENGRVTGDTVIHDDYTRVMFTKHDTDGEILEGVEFTLFDEDGNSVMKALSDRDGLVTFEKIPFGKFTIEETAAPAGYIRKTGALIMFTVDGTFVNTGKPAGDIRNTPNEIRIRKVDQDGKILSGVEFGLFDQNGNQVMTAVSDENGMVVFRKMPAGSYAIRETKAISGYLLCKDQYSFTVDDNFRNAEEPVAVFVNRLKRVKYIKTDTAGKFLAGVEFSLISKETGETVETVISDANGVFTFTKFDYGDWIIRETRVPEGFNRMEDIELHVGDDWTEPAPFTCVNIPNHYEFLKTDNKGNPMAGVTFALEGQEGNIIRNLVSGEDGIVHVTDLAPGRYVIRELTTLEGFTVNDDAIVVEINENYVIPEKMFTMINYPVIQTGVELSTPFLLLGTGLILFAVLNGVVWLVSRKKKSGR